MLYSIIGNQVEALLLTLPAYADGSITLSGADSYVDVYDRWSIASPVYLIFGGVLY